MAPSDPVLASVLPGASDDAPPDYVRELAQAAHYLPPAQRALLRPPLGFGI